MAQDRLVNRITADMAIERGYDGDFWPDVDKSSGERFRSMHQSTLQRWLRERFNQCFSVMPRRNKRGKFCVIFYIDYPRNKDNVFQKIYEADYDTWEDALEAGIRTALRLIKK